MNFEIIFGENNINCSHLWFDKPYFIGGMTIPAQICNYCQSRKIDLVSIMQLIDRYKSILDMDRKCYEARLIELEAHVKMLEQTTVWGNSNQGLRL